MSGQLDAAYIILLLRRIHLMVQIQMR